MDLNLVRLEYEIITSAPVQLTTILYGALQAFEEHFRSSCCMATKELCISCSQKIECPYRTVFEQRLSSDPEIVRLHQKPSLPFSLYISGLDGNTLSCTIGMVIIGSAVNHIGLFHVALLKMVEAAVGNILPTLEVTIFCYSLDYQGDRHKIKDTLSIPDGVILLSGQHVLHNNIHSECVRLSFKSPLRLLSNGTIAHSFDFGMFFCSQLRRCSSLFAYYGSAELDLDFVNISQLAKNITVLDDGMHYGQPLWTNRLNKAGLVGMSEFAGLVEPMFSFLLLGSYFNAGKGAALGLGFHRVEGL